MVVKKLGQPVPDSYFISEVKSGSPQPAQANTPARFSSLSGLVPARSVPSSRITSKDSAGRFFFHFPLDSFPASLRGRTLAPGDASHLHLFSLASTPSMLFGDADDAAMPLMLIPLA